MASQPSLALIPAGIKLDQQPGLYRKGVGILPSPVPHFKAFALPNPENEQRRKPTPICTTSYSIFLKRSKMNRHISGGRLCCYSSFREYQKLRSFEIRTTNAYKRLHYIKHTHTFHPKAFCERCDTNVQINKRTASGTALKSLSLKKICSLIRLFRKHPFAKNVH